MTSGQRLEACGRPCSVIVGSPQPLWALAALAAKLGGLGLLDLEGPLHADAV